MPAPVLAPGVRYTLCLACEHAVDRPLIGVQCDVCRCVMRLKVQLPNATCPLGKW